MTYCRKNLQLDRATIALNNNTVLCYGHFNVIHPGHLRYLRHAKNLGDQLVVAVISNKDLDRSLEKYWFTEEERTESVENLQIVDNVITLNHLTLSELVNTIKPRVLVLGTEFEANQTKQVRLAISAVKKWGKVVFHAGEIHYASTNLLYSTVTDIEHDRKISFNKICRDYNVTSEMLHNRIDKFYRSKLLVIGDTIVDNYVACDAIGMSAEAPVLVVKELENREFIGGSAIVALHIKALGSKCHYISVTGDDEKSSMVKRSLIERGIDVDIYIDESRPTTYKTRYMVDNQKLFRVSKMNEHKISENIENKIIKRIFQVAPNINGIVVSDFSYGVITEKIIDSISEVSKKFNIKLYGDSQCSSQIGSISKFSEFDLITPTEKESRVALNDTESGIEWIANTLMDNTKSKNMLIKLGQEGFIAYKRMGENFIQRQHFPALSVNPVDVAGAGDSLLAALSTSFSSGGAMIESCLIASCVASIIVQQIGNNPILINDVRFKIDQLMT